LQTVTEQFLLELSEKSKKWMKRGILAAGLGGAVAGGYVLGKRERPLLLKDEIVGKGVKGWLKSFGGKLASERLNKLDNKFYELVQKSKEARKAGNIDLANTLKRQAYDSVKSRAATFYIARKLKVR
jgi:hypothetical protein